MLINFLRKNVSVLALLRCFKNHQANQAEAMMVRMGQKGGN
jgi:hypothetical protein